MTQGQKSSSLNLTNETDDIHVTNEPPGKKSRVRRWRIDGKAKTNHRWATSLRLMQRLTMPTCPALNKSNNLIIKDLTNALLEQIRNVWSLTFLPLVPGGEDGEWPTSWSQDDCRGSGQERPIRSSRRWCASCFFYHYHYHLFSIDILPAVLEALSQRRHHVLVVFHQGSEERGHSPPWWKYGAGHLLEYGGVLRHVVQIQKFREVVEDVEGSDV